MGVSWFGLLLILTSNTPQTHRFITEKERQFILKETKKAIETRKLCQSVLSFIILFYSKYLIILLLASSMGFYIYKQSMLVNFRGSL
jgi:hypothetical protein